VGQLRGLCLSCAMAMWAVLRWNRLSHLEIMSGVYGLLKQWVPMQTCQKQAGSCGKVLKTKGLRKRVFEMDYGPTAKPEQLWQEAGSAGVRIFYMTVRPQEGEGE